MIIPFCSIIHVDANIILDTKDTAVNKIVLIFLELYSSMDRTGRQITNVQGNRLYVR